MKRNSIILSLAFLLSGSMLPAQELRLLVGTYTENTQSEGIYMYSFDCRTAGSTLLGMAPSGNPSFVIASPEGNRVYAVNEYNDGRQGVSSFILEGDSLRCLDSRPIPKDEVDGGDPCNLLFDGETVISSNYTGGSVTAFALDADGSIGDMTQHFSCGVEYRRAPSGLSHVSGPAHMHCTVPSPDGKYLFVTDLGMDCIHRFVKGDGDHPLGTESIAWKNRSRTKFGPRHMVFSGDGRFAYLRCELGDKLVVFSYTDGSLTPIQTLTAYRGKGHGSADVHLSPDGRFLYTSHRLKGDGIAVFAVDSVSGNVSRAGFQPTGKHPRNFAVTPDGKWFLCACRDDNRIEIYSIDPESGSLAPTGKAIEVGAPVCIQILQ